MRGKVEYEGEIRLYVQKCAYRRQWLRDTVAGTYIIQEHKDDCTRLSRCGDVVVCKIGWWFNTYRKVDMKGRWMEETKAQMERGKSRL